MELLVPLALFLAILIGVVLNATNPAKKRMGKKTRKAMGGGLFVMNEIFNPSANETVVVMEEKREERKALPSPEDKKNPAQ